jgi:hypothetical protein
MAQETTGADVIEEFSESFGRKIAEVGKFGNPIQSAVKDADFGLGHG